MARRRTKKRTHAGARNGSAQVPAANSSASRVPKSMVIRIGAGEVGASISQLVKDVRTMMEPHTASRLKVCYDIQWLCQLLIKRIRNEDQTAYGIIRQWLALSVSHISSSFRALPPGIQTCGWPSLHEAPRYISESRNTPSAKTCLKP